MAKTKPEAPKAEAPRPRQRVFDGGPCHGTTEVPDGATVDRTGREATIPLPTCVAIYQRSSVTDRVWRYQRSEPIYTRTD
jgi:hypothetical protein